MGRSRWEPSGGSLKAWTRRVRARASSRIDCPRNLKECKLLLPLLLVLCMQLFCKFPSCSRLLFMTPVHRHVIKKRE